MTPCNVAAGYRFTLRLESSPPWKRQVWHRLKMYSLKYMCHHSVCGRGRVFSF